MTAEAVSIWTALPGLLFSLAAAFGLYLLACILYVVSTPWKEWTLVRKRQSAAAGLTLCGALLGFALPIAAGLAASLSLLEFVVWGVVVLLVQLVVFRLVEAVMPNFRAAVEEDDAGPAIVLLAIKLAVSVMFAAALSDPNLPRFPS